MATPSTHSTSVLGRRARALERTAVISAWIATILVPTGFAKIAIAPIALMLLATLVGPTMRRLRWAALVVAGAYAIPFTLYAVNPDRARSLSRDMDPIWWVVIPLLGVVYLVAYYRGRRRRSGDLESASTSSIPA
jgi:peptidoglycan/LPS O-acetylase OafA/YrhL